MDDTTPIAKLGQAQRRSPSIYAFLVPATCLLACIFTVLAWIHGNSEPGTAADADFFQTISSVCMQLLGVSTSLWPAVTNLHLSRIAQVLVYALAAGGTFLTIAAPFLYLFHAVNWSGSALFVGSILQSMLQLQLILGISKQKEHQA